jgi:FtsH-binding integral membrane protein
MDRTLRAALVAALIGLVAVGGIAFFLGVPAITSVIAGVVAAVLFGGLILAAARRSAGFDDEHR